MFVVICGISTLQLGCCVSQGNVKSKGRNWHACCLMKLEVGLCQKEITEASVSAAMKELAACLTTEEPIDKTSLVKEFYCEILSHFQLSSTNHLVLCPSDRIFCGWKGMEGRGASDGINQDKKKAVFHCIFLYKHIYLYKYLHLAEC